MSTALPLYKNIEVRQVKAPVANASNTDSNSDIIDMAGYEGVIFMVPIEDSAATGVAVLKLEEHTLNQDSGMAAITGASATKTCAVNDDINNKLLVVECFRPRERYVQAVITSATANIAFGTMTAILYGHRKMPVTEHSTILNSASVTSASE